MKEADKKFIALTYKRNGHCTIALLKSYDIDVTKDFDLDRRIEFCKELCPFKSFANYTTCQPSHIRRLALAVMKEHKTEFFEYLI